METLLPGFWYLEDKKFKNKLLRKKLKILSTKLYSFKNNNGFKSIFFLVVKREIISLIKLKNIL